MKMRFGVVILLLVAGLAAGAADAFQPAPIAQQILNPTNDPAVQRGIDQRQQRIQACVQQQEANMNATARMQADENVRNNCTTLNPAVAAVRG